ncbi:Uncharacterised protein [Vibrio cholerae]|nr:Uncharacterised protein [Vibrio cholerae]
MTLGKTTHPAPSIECFLIKTGSDVTFVSSSGTVGLLIAIPV